MYNRSSEWNTVRQSWSNQSMILILSLKSWSSSLQSQVTISWRRILDGDNNFIIIGNNCKIQSRTNNKSILSRRKHNIWRRACKGAKLLIMIVWVIIQLVIFNWIYINTCIEFTLKRTARISRFKWKIWTFVNAVVRQRTIWTIFTTDTTSTHTFTPIPIIKLTTLLTHTNRRTVNTITKRTANQTTTIINQLISIFTSTTSSGIILAASWTSRRTYIAGYYWWI